MPTSVRPLPIRGIIAGLAAWLALAIIASAAGITGKLVPPAPQIVVAILTILLLALAGFHSPLRTWVRSVDLRALVELHLAREQSELAVSHFQALADLKTQDVDQFKEGMSTMAQSN